jgi:hypothetical protein
MRTVWLAPCVLAACGGIAAPPAPAVVSPMPAVDTCGAAPYAAVIGQSATALERVLIMRPLRVLRPTDPVTLDLNPTRINFIIDGAEAISAITCG